MSKNPRLTSIGHTNLKGHLSHFTVNVRHLWRLFFRNAPKTVTLAPTMSKTLVDIEILLG